jgi:epoxyqueuosine reductase
MRFAKEQMIAGSEEARAVVERLRTRAGELGLDAMGFASPTDLPDPAVLRGWLAAGMQAGMSYMERHADLRLDPERFFPGVRSILCVALNYYVPEGVASTAGVASTPGAVAGPRAFPPGRRIPRPRVARYAWGTDYHGVLRGKLHSLLATLQDLVPGARGRVAVDTAPVLERHWAQRAGVGWIGRNGCLIVPRLGSWVFLGEIFLDLPLPADRPRESRCGKCRRCLDACPSGALIAPARLDARKCIAYWTVEHRGAFPAGAVPSTAPWVFGCDICQEVCPWNRFACETREPAFRHRGEALEWDLDAWRQLDRGRFQRLFAGTALERAGFEGISRNLEALTRQGG